MDDVRTLDVLSFRYTGYMCRTLYLVNRPAVSD